MLIAAIWLLVLAGAMAALLTLRALNEARDASDLAERAEARLAAEAAVETVLAARLFGAEAPLGQATPATATLVMEGRTVAVEISSEDGRIDLQEADPALIAAVLDALEVDRVRRDEIMAAAAARRASGNSMTGYSQMRSMLAGDALPDGSCLSDHFTIASGRRTPAPNQIAPALAARLPAVTGVAGMPGDRATASAGSAVRIVARPEGAPPLTVVARISGLIAAPVAIAGWWRGSCTGPASASARRTS